MIPRHDPADVQRWQDEVARDPGAPAFVLLAEAHRRAKRLELARRVCQRGLERDSANVHGHYVLGRIFRDEGEGDHARDAWRTALRLDPHHRAARRALGYLCLERRDWRAAIVHLEWVAAADGGDARLSGALDLARRRLRMEAAGRARTAPVRALDRIGASVAGPLDRFARGGAFRFVLLLDRSGRVLTQRGFPRELDIAALASLGAGIHAASSALAGLLGRPPFEQLCQGEGDRQAFLGAVPSPSGELLVLGSFGNESNVGMVRIAFRKLLQELSGATWPTDLGPADPAALEDELAAGLRHAATMG